MKLFLLDNFVLWCWRESDIESVQDMESRLAALSLCRENDYAGLRELMSYINKHNIHRSDLVAWAGVSLLTNFPGEQKREEGEETLTHIVHNHSLHCR